MSYQQFHEDVERYHASGIRADYFWMDPSQGFEELEKVKKKHPGSQYRFYPAMRADGILTLWICLYSVEGAYLDGFDDLWPCPPRC